MGVFEMIVGISGGLFMLAAFVAVLRLIKAWLLHRTLRDAIQRDSAIAPSLIDKIDRAGRRGAATGGDDRNGLVLIAIGVAILGFALIVGDPAWLRYGVGAALFPMLVGAALLGRHVWHARRSLAGAG